MGIVVIFLVIRNGMTIPKPKVRYKIKPVDNFHSIFWRQIEVVFLSIPIRDVPRPLSFKVWRDLDVSTISQIQIDPKNSTTSIFAHNSQLTDLVPPKIKPSLIRLEPQVNLWNYFVRRQNNSRLTKQDYGSVLINRRPTIQNLVDA